MFKPWPIKIEPGNLLIWGYENENWFIVLKAPERNNMIIVRCIKTQTEQFSYEVGSTNRMVYDKYFYIVKDGKKIKI
tara:strand:- start:1145 stop:1375 length:231 start_codon:yes stop_codon:yes gene_type:complete